MRGQAEGAAGLQAALQALCPEREIRSAGGHVVFETEHPHGDGSDLVMSPAQDLSFGGAYGDGIAFGRIRTFDAADRPGEHPGMETAQRFLAAFLEVEAGHTLRSVGLEASRALYIFTQIQASVAA